MQQFKVGDYVRVPEYNKCFKFKGTFEDEDGTIYIADGYDEIFGQQGWLETACELWQPKEGEWCWFWDDITAHRPTLRKFGCVELPQYCADNAVFWDSEQNPFTNCAPFIGELPSFLKECTC